jgi:hypothetical protein
VKRYLNNVLIAADQLANAVLGGWPDETISARAYRRGWRIRMALINALFRDPDHCRNSFFAERDRAQSAKEYRAMRDTVSDERLGESHEQIKHV